MRTMLFHNPKAGTGGHVKKELLAALRLAGHDVSYCSTKSPAFKKGLDKPAELIVVAGGDGTVAKVLTHMHDRSVPVGIVPLGTANNIATSLGIAGEVEEIAPDWDPERTRRLTIGKATGPWGHCSFVEAIGFGALARATDRKIGTKSDGDKRLLLGRDAFRQALTEMSSQDPDLTVDGQPLDGGLLAVEILNVGYAGPGLPLWPSADPGDDLLDIVCVRTDQREAMLEWLAAPEHRMPPPVTVKRGRKVTFTWDGVEPLRIDDDFPSEPEGSGTVTVELEREAINVMVPEPLQASGGADREKDLEER